MGLYVWNQYETSCSNITVSGNQVNWTNKEGNLNPAWNANNYGVVDGWQDNNWGANIDATILPEELTANCDILSNPATELAIKKIAFYPNPTKDKITIKFEDHQEKGTIEILSITGQLLEQKHFLNTSFLELKMNQPNGVYIIKITDSNYETNFRRIVKH